MPVTPCTETAPTDGPGFFRGIFFDLALDLLSVTGIDGSTIDVNPAWEAVLGYTREEILARPFVEFLHPEDVPEVLRQIERVVGGGEPIPFECRVRPADGSYRWIRWSPNFVLRDNAFYAVARDVTEEKGKQESLLESQAGFGLLAQAVERHQDALAVSEARFRTMFESAAVGIALTDLGGELVEANPALGMLLGHDPSALRGRPLADFVDADGLSGDAELFAELVAGERTSYRVDRRFLRRDGSTFPGRETVSLVGDGVGGPRFAMSMVEDMSLALVDELTGLANRRAFLAVGQRQLQLGVREHRTPAVLFMDLDGMKRINDTFGHREGDRALVEVARILSRTFRASDMAARYGGDEFCVLLFDGTSAQLAAERFESEVVEWNDRSGGPFELSVSVGAALFDPLKHASLEEVVAEADRAMYQVKTRQT